MALYLLLFLTLTSFASSSEERNINCATPLQNTACEKFPTDCNGEMNRKEQSPSEFMKNINESKYRIIRFAYNKKYLVNFLLTTFNFHIF